MAIYHFSIKPISRSSGRSAVAAAAYRSAENLIDERYGKNQDYTQKTGVELSQIYAPDYTRPELLDRNELWNEVEKAEKRKDALLAREFEIAFPSELNAQQRKNMLDDLCNQIVRKYGAIVDASIHAPHIEGGSDERNYHAHIMLTTRAVNKKSGTFEAKKYRDFNKEMGSNTVKTWRKDFADIVNHRLKQIGCDERVSHLSYKDLKYDLEPTSHEGPKVTELRRRGIDTEISLKNDAIKTRNNELKELKHLMNELDQEITVSNNLKSTLQSEKTQEKDQLQNDINRFYDLQNQYIDFSNQHFALLAERDNAIEEIKKRRRQVEKIVHKYGDRSGDEFDAMHKKYRSRPDFWIEPRTAKSEIEKISSNYSKKLEILSKETNFLSIATELTLVYRSLSQKKIELNIPRQKKIFGFAISSDIPPSAETLQADLKVYFFKELGNKFEYDFHQATMSAEQKRKDAELQRQRELQREAAALAQHKENQERKEDLDRHIAEKVRISKKYAYANDFEYDYVDPTVCLKTSVIISQIIEKKDFSQDLTEKIRCIEADLHDENLSKTAYEQYLKMLDADKRLFKDYGKEKAAERIALLHDKFSSKYAEKLEYERLRAEEHKHSYNYSNQYEQKRKNDNDFEM